MTLNLTSLLNSISDASSRSLVFYTNRKQDTLMRYLFCGIEKVDRITKGISVLYPHCLQNMEFEFSCGILLRSLMMDMVISLKAKGISLKVESTSFEEVKQELYEFSKEVNNDGAVYLIQEVYQSNILTPEKKLDYATKFAEHFRELYDYSSGKPQVKKERKINLSAILKDYKNVHSVGVSIADLYYYYSKYDHLSHFSSLSKLIPNDRRMDHLHVGILFTAVYLHDLLTLSYAILDMKPLALIITEFHAVLSDQPFEQFVRPVG